MSRARDVADIQDNLGGAVPPFVAGKNKIINGDFGIWQRGTSFSVNNSNAYTADRFYASSTDNSTISQQTFTAGSAPVSGYESTYFLRYARSTTTYQDYLFQRVEDVRTLAGQTVTISMWLKANASGTVGLNIGQNFGSGGSSAVEQYSNLTVSTSWARYTATYTLGSMSGKTIGSGSFLYPYISFPSSGLTQVDIWGVQLEAGSIATPFTTATGTIQGELAACQRYYFRATAGTTNGYLGNGFASGTSTTTMQVPFPVMMRIVPTSLDYSNLRVIDQVAGYTGGTYILSSDISQTMGATYLSGTSGMTQYRPLYLTGTTAAGYIGFSAEL